MICLQPPHPTTLAVHKLITTRNAPGFKMDPFEEDVRTAQRLLGEKYGPGVRRRISEIAERLIALHKENRIKINHSVMEYVLAAYLASSGYRVELEHPLANDLVADVMAWKNGRSLIIEVETGFTSPENALDPQAYLTARVISKIARYSPHADRFSLATPAHNILQIPKTLLKPASARKDSEIQLLKSLCDQYYRTPEIAAEKLSKMRLHAIYVINVDLLEVMKLSPRKYLEKYGDLCPSLQQIGKYVEACRNLRLDQKLK